MIWLVGAGASCMFGALVLGTAWTLAAYSIIGFNADRLADRIHAEQVQLEDMMERVGPGPQD